MSTDGTKTYFIYWESLCSSDGGAVLILVDILGRLSNFLSNYWFLKHIHHVDRCCDRDNGKYHGESSERRKVTKRKGSSSTKEIGTKTCSTKREQRRNNRSGGSTKWRIEDARSRMNDVGNEK